MVLGHYSQVRERSRTNEVANEVVSEKKVKAPCSNCFVVNNERINQKGLDMNHDPLQWLVTRVMRCGKFGLLLALMLRKDRGNLVGENTRAWPLTCSPLMFNVRHRTWFDKLIKQLAIRLGRQKTTSKSLVITTNGINSRFSNRVHP